MWFSRAKRILLEIQAASVCPEAWFDTAYLDSQLKWIRETGDTIQKSWEYSPIDWDGLK
jgi:hypothetical protein